MKGDNRGSRLANESHDSVVWDDLNEWNDWKDRNAIRSLNGLSQVNSHCRMVEVTLALFERLT